MLFALLYTHVVWAADSLPVAINCSKDLVAQASKTFPDHACHLGLQEPGGFGVFCDQRIDGVLTDIEVPIFIGLDAYRFKEVPEESRPKVWAFMAQEFMHLSNTDFIEIIGGPVVCQGPNIKWWTVELHPPLDDHSRPTREGTSRTL